MKWIDHIDHFHLAFHYSCDVLLEAMSILTELIAEALLVLFFISNDVQWVENEANWLHCFLVIDSRGEHLISSILSFDAAHSGSPVVNVYKQV